MMSKIVVYYLAREQRLDIFNEDMSKHLCYIISKHNLPCEICGDKRATEIHHINTFRNQNDILNLEIVCYNCHLAIHCPKNHKAYVLKYPQLYYFIDMVKYFKERKYKLRHFLILDKTFKFDT